MCNLYSMTMPLDAVRHIFDVQPDRARVGNLEPMRSIWPKDEAPIVLIDDGDRELVRGSWGFLTPNKSKKTGKWLKPQAWNNTRDDKVRSAPLWRDSFETRRCLIPATAYAEATGRNPATYHWANVRDAEGFAFAGIWKRQVGTLGETEIDAMVFSIMTASPNSFAAQYHTRMPVILPPDAYETWLTGSPDAAYSLLGGISADLMLLIGEGERMTEQPEISS
ncbi:SOS response-associated peptidase family protein [uncultured Roseobacter sp.]|uniref:SOS response-associated peptidase n=1 Tax=uncultured Roseobacter sp. TaxID=114847 RepID=UPI002625B298|nr:SOS response-associated peptidase family protein [uncultured Roseobacter sp.]